MKRLTAILLCFIIVFNLYGYRLVMSYLEQESSLQVEARIDRQDYKDAELISIKTTLNLPYYTSSPEFERVYGSIHINGIDYEYVKRRVYQDTLELLCLPNFQKTALSAVSSELAKSSTDGASVPGKKISVVKIVLPDYCQSFTGGSEVFNERISNKYFCSPINFHSSDYSLLQEKPPRCNA